MSSGPGHCRLAGWSYFFFDRLTGVAAYKYSTSQWLPTSVNSKCFGYHARLSVSAMWGQSKNETGSGNPKSKWTVWSAIRRHRPRWSGIDRSRGRRGRLGGSRGPSLRDVLRRPRRRPPRRGRRRAGSDWSSHSRAMVGRTRTSKSRRCRFMSRNHISR